MTELKCPKCGETELIYDTFNLNGKGCGIKCGNCGYEIEDCESIEEAKFKWKSENDPKALRSCPFCGANPFQLEIRMDENREPYIYCYGCDTVYYNDNSFKGTDELIRRWNRRVQ